MRLGKDNLVVAQEKAIRSSICLPLVTKTPWRSHVDVRTRVAN